MFDPPLLGAPQHYLKTLCLTVPASAAVIQASHHGLQAVSGLVAQLVAGQSLQVWEHGVLMRERLIYRERVGGREGHPRSQSCGV